MNKPGPENNYQSSHVDLLRFSYRHWIGKELIENHSDSLAVARYLFEAPFVILSHNTASDPILNYANQRCLDLFELDWGELITMPSRLTAEPQERDERAGLMQRVRQYGYIDDYSGIRISKSGKRFFIKRATVWNLIDPEGILKGQAALFPDWQTL